LWGSYLIRGLSYQGIPELLRTTATPFKQSGAIGFRCMLEVRDMDFLSPDLKATGTQDGRNIGGSRFPRYELDR